MDEVQNLILRTQGEMEVTRLTKALEKQEAILQKLVKLELKNPANPHLVKGMEEAGQKIVALNAKLADVQKSIPKSTSFNTQGMQQLGYALQDFTSSSGGLAQKLNSITNNLQMVAASMGMTGPMFLAVTGAMTAFQLFLNNYERIDAALKGMPSPEEVKAATDKKAAKQAEYDAVVGAPKPGEAATAGRARDAIAEIGGEKVATNLEQALEPSVPGWSQGDQWAWRYANRHKFPGGKLTGKEINSALYQAEGPARAAAAREEVKRLLTEVVKPGPAGIAAQRRIREIMQANPGRFSKADIAAIDNITATNTGADIGPPAPENDERRFAELQRQLEEKEGANAGITYGGKFPGGAPAAQDAGAAADAHATMASDRQSRSEALQSGHAGPTVREPGRGRRRRYANTSDPAVEAMNRQVDSMMFGGMGGGGPDPAVMALQMKLNAMQRRMSGQLGGMPAGQYSSMPENW